MKTKLLFVLAAITFLFQFCSDDTKKSEDNTESAMSPVEVKQATNYDTIMDYFNKFVIRSVDSKMPFRFLPLYFHNDTIIRGILAIKERPFVLCVLGVDKNNAFTVDFVGSTMDGTAGDPSSHWDYEEIKSRNNDLKEKLDKSNIPLRLDDFPLIIKMERGDFDDICSKIKPPKYLAYLGIDPKEKDHFTVSILGSNEDGDNVHPEHKAGLYGGETWPDRNYTYRLNARPETDVKL